MVKEHGFTISKLKENCDELEKWHGKVSEEVIHI